MVSVKGWPHHPGPCCNNGQRAWHTARIWAALSGPGFYLYGRVGWMVATVRAHQYCFCISQSMNHTAQIAVVLLASTDLCSLQARRTAAPKQAAYMSSYACHRHGHHVYDMIGLNPVDAVLHHLLLKCARWSAFS